LLPIAITAAVSAATTLLAIVITYVLTKRREHEADWRKLKFSQYQELVLALSGIVPERTSQETQSRYADAVNSMALVAPLAVLDALAAFQAEISYSNRHNRAVNDRHDELLGVLFRAMRHDIQPSHTSDDSAFPFHLLTIPPEAAP
jgi:hypothetical protein